MWCQMVLRAVDHEIRKPKARTQGVNKRNLKNWAYVAAKICFDCAVKAISLWVSVVRAVDKLYIKLGSSPSIYFKDLTSYDVSVLLLSLSNDVNAIIIISIQSM